MPSTPEVDVIMLKIPVMLVSFCIKCLHYCYRFKGQGNTLLLRLRRAGFGDLLLCD